MVFSQSSAFKFILSLGFLGMFFTSIAVACPEIEGIPDFNCDGDLQIVVIGDSFVSGFGDTANKNKGGYVLRAQRKLKKASFSNLGKPGFRTGELLELLDDAFKDDKAPELLATLRNADVVILDLGRNDRWLFGEPRTAFSNLAKAAQQIRSSVNKLEGVEPMVVTAVLMLPNRGSQGPWVKDLNSFILKSSTARRPADLRFDLVSKRLLNSDQIHPSSIGYDALSKTFLTYLKGSLARRMRALRLDTDSDGLPDTLESKKFLTDPNLADTDGDGVSDGDEILKFGTNPLGL
jgi:lysophospholipase L1-like esterase